MAPGQRVRLIATCDPYTTLRPGAAGTVAFVDDLGTVHVDWDIGSNLGLIPGEESWETLPAEKPEK
ncbi:DUF4314 domain-containing protein [Corynebacterium striatum]|uniref:DUF4314 domain-containing protein n=1 Tax=Corynebacterium striatum TaxID=43770 RepID=UPI0034D45298